MAKPGNTISMEVSTLGKSTINGVFLVQQAMLEAWAPKWDDFYDGFPSMFNIAMDNDAFEK